MEQAIMMEATLVAPTRSNGDGLLAAHKEHSNRSKELFSVQDWHVQCFRGVMGEFVWTFEQQPHGMWEGGCYMYYTWLLLDVVSASNLIGCRGVRESLPGTNLIR
jgi:hypothetical protein